MSWAANPDLHFSHARILAFLLLTTIFILGVFGWGRLVCRAVRLSDSSWFEELLLGSSSLAFLGHCLGLLGWLGPGWQWLWVLPPLVGLLALFRWRRPVHLRASGLLVLLELGLAFTILSRYLRASLLLGHTDPMIYHLYSPRLWWDEGRVFVPAHAASVYVASYWETFLLWGIGLFSGPGGAGLIEGHLFAQWAHVGVGVLGVSLALRRLFEPVFPKGSLFLPVVVLAGVASLPLKSISMMAKSDWGAVFWALGGALLLLREKRTRSTDFLGGAVLGIGIAARLTSVFFLAGFLPVLFWARLKSESRGRVWRFLADSGAGIFLVVAPFLFRNLVATGNPFFPWLSAVFSSDALGPTLAAIPDVQKPAFSLASANVPAKLSMLARQTPFGAAFLLWPLAERLNPVLRKLRWIAVATALSLCLALAWPIAPAFQPRWIGVPLLLQGALGAAILASILSLRKSFASWGAAVAGILLVVVAAEWDGWTMLATGPSPDLRIRDSKRMFIGGAAKAWLRQNAIPSDLVVSTWDSAFYYLIPLRVTSLAGEAELDREAHLSSPEAILGVLRRRGGRYLLDTLSWMTFEGRGLIYWGWYSKHLAPLYMQYPETIVFRDDDLSIVVDLALLEERVFSYCVKDR